MSTAKRTTASRIGPHTFVRDEDTPLPPRLGPQRHEPWPQDAAMCRRCKLPGRPGDDRHPDGSLPPPVLSADQAAAYRELDNAITGERDED